MSILSIKYYNFYSICYSRVLCFRLLFAIFISLYYRKCNLYRLRGVEFPMCVIRLHIWKYFILFRTYVNFSRSFFQHNPNFIYQSEKKFFSFSDGSYIMLFTFCSCTRIFHSNFSCIEWYPKCAIYAKRNENSFNWIYHCSPS